MPSNLENVNIEASPQRNGYNCLTSLTIFVLSASSSLKYLQTIYNPLNQAGQLNFEQLPQKFLIDSQPLKAKEPSGSNRTCELCYRPSELPRSLHGRYLCLDKEVEVNKVITFREYGTAKGNMAKLFPEGYD
uniref:Uncharacterized protein n=1 Tax=Meloidogyne javanica TaxID=6303 RepID=A0A915MBF9_MELJA